MPSGTNSGSEAFFVRCRVVVRERCRVIVLQALHLAHARQLIGKTYIFNPPMWLTMAYKVAGGFMSRKSLEKVQVHPRGVNAAASGQLCPFAMQLLGGAAVLPTFLGGTCEADEVLPAAARTASDLAEAVGRPLPSLAGLPATPELQVSERSRSNFSSLEKISKQIPLSVSECDEVFHDAEDGLGGQSPTSPGSPSCYQRVCCCILRRRQHHGSSATLL
ncbi:unnamed protein product [Polarella glacialis]|uniref:CRAL-TRIO domain-containing protein n=1 Tax=Polarella glacialis TaxID=89957 RepID=A0A813KHV8_POLGL|nr:unnamed protein product [Polarella glacialis]